MGISFTNPDWELPNQFARAFLGEEALTDITRGAVEYAQSINADLIALGWQQEYQPTTAIDDLKDINIPMLILAGDQDDSNGNPKSLAEALPKAEFKLVEGDHNNTYKSPSFAKEVIDFLN